ncbi:MAG TPA: hypothetical protein VGM84_15075 [Steroidobacteraceae bacterium]
MNLRGLAIAASVAGFVTTFLILAAAPEPVRAGGVPNARSVAAVKGSLPRVPANSGFEDTGQVKAVWVRRTAHLRFVGSCDMIYERVKFMLLELGARASDLTLKVNAIDCGTGMAPSLDATFSVLAPLDTEGNNAPGMPVEAHWQTVELKKTWQTDAPPPADMCTLFERFTNVVLPVFSTRNVKVLPRDLCETRRVGLVADVLKPA